MYLLTHHHKHRVSSEMSVSNLLHHVLHSQLLLLDSRPKLKEYTKERKFDDDGDVIDIASGWLEDQDQEFPYNVTRALEKRIRDMHFC